MKKELYFLIIVLPVFFNIEAQNLYHDSPNGNIKAGDDLQVSNLFSPLYSETTHTYLKNSTSNTYRLHYPSGGSNSLEGYFPIDINSPSSVDFAADWTGVDCFQENIGSNSISAGGDRGNYEYSINNEANWFPFSNITVHTVANLVAKNYQVKIKDINNCIAQQ